MVEYNCKVCNFSSRIRSHYERHTKTKKHLANVLCAPSQIPHFPSQNSNNQISYKGDKVNREVSV